MTISKLALLRRLLVVIVSITGVLLMGGSSWAAGQDSSAAGLETKIVTATNIFAFAGENPCLPGTRQMTINHRSVFTAGQADTVESDARHWSTLDQSGSFTLEPQRPGQSAYRGRFHVQAGNPDARYGDYVLTVQLLGTGSDGSAFRARLFEHIQVTEQGYEIKFTTDSFGTDQLTCS